MRVLFLLSLGFAAFVALATGEQRIMGGSLATISQYPFAAAVLKSVNSNIYSLNCGGSIITRSAILTAASCCSPSIPSTTRVRVGSSYHNSLGFVHEVRSCVQHPTFNSQTLVGNVAVIRSQSFFAVNNNTIAPVVIASPNYIINDNANVWAIGWGATNYGGQPSNQLRHVELYTVNQGVCRNRYSQLGTVIADSMLCAGWLDVGGRDHCTYDAGGPVLHGRIAVGVASFGQNCGLAYYPGVNSRVSSYSSWIQTNV